jgi:hypothetical protein
VNRLLSHLAVLERDKLITVLYDEKIPASAEWDAELNRQL